MTTPWRVAAILTVWAFLLATRQRTRDRLPKAVDFLPGTPEETSG